MRRVLAAALLAIAASPMLSAQGRVAVMAGPPANRRPVWVLGPDNRLTEYDTVDFRAWVRGVVAPPGARDHPENLLVLSSGIVMYAETLPGTSLRHLWSTSNHAHELVGGADDRRADPEGGFRVTSATPTVVAAADGKRLFWFENRFTTVERGAEVSRTGDFLSWTTDLAGNDPQNVVRYSFDPCKCTTGACSESCPETTVWAPAAGISDFFYLTRWVPGQVGSQFLDGTLYTLSGGPWSGHKLDHAVDHFLDAADHGHLFVESPQDYSGDDDPADAVSNRILLNAGGKSVTIFDEWARFKNAGYAADFTAERAAISPDLARVAFTIVGPPPSQEILPRVEGKKTDPAEVQRLRTELAALPRTEVVAMAEAGKVLFSLPNTGLVGWIDGGHLLVVQQGELKVVDVTTGAARSTGAKADAAMYVFLP